MLRLPDGGAQDQIIHIPFPSLVLDAEIDLFGTEAQAGQVVALGGLNLEGDRVAAEVGTDILRRSGSGLAEGGRIQREAIEFHNDWERDNDRPLEALDERREHWEGGEKNVSVDYENGVAGDCTR